MQGKIEADNLGSVSRRVVDTRLCFLSVAEDNVTLQVYDSKSFLWCFAGTKAIIGLSAKV